MLFDTNGNLQIIQGPAPVTLSAWTTVNWTGGFSSALAQGTGYQAVVVQLNHNSSITGGAVTWQGTSDGINWITIPAQQVLDPSSATFAQIPNPYTFVASANKAFLILMGGYQSIRALESTPMTGAGASITPFVVQLGYAPVNYHAITNVVKVDGSGVSQPVSAASLPLPAGASTAAKQPALGTAGSASADVISVQGVASMTALKVDGSGVTQPVSGAVTASQATGTNLHTVVDSGTVTAVTAITNALPTGANTLGSVKITDGTTVPGVIAGTTALKTDLSSVAGTVTAAAAAGIQKVGISDSTGTTLNSVVKGTQAANALGTQDLKDSGRTAITFSATGVAAGTSGTETAITLTKSAGTAATSSAVSFVVTSGKTFRITNITVASRGNATATAQKTIFNLRLNTGGAVVVTTTPVLMSLASATVATASVYDRFQLEIPDGYEIVGNGTIQIGLTANTIFVTNGPSWDVVITGFEY
jgi:hypothetical protein